MNQIPMLIGVFAYLSKIVYDRERNDAETG